MAPVMVRHPFVRAIGRRLLLAAGVHRAGAFDAGEPRQFACVKGR